jgi:LysM repeat protein
MIEILNTYDQINNDDLKALKQLPKNVRQIGEISENKKIYLEDYVYTYLNQYASSDLDNPQIAILLGHYYKYESDKVVLISGAVQARYFFNDQSNIILTNETWTYIYDKVKEFFDDYEIVGWMFSHPGYSVGINDLITKIHTTNFPGSDKVLFVMDPIEKEDAFYLYESQNLNYQEGYYIYYERNENMHKYMLNDRIVEERTEPEPEEPVVVNYRRHVQSRKQEAYHRKLVNMLYVTSGALAIIVLVIGIALMDNYDKMKSLETTVNHLTQTFGGNTMIEENDSENLVGNEETDETVNNEGDNEIDVETNLNETQIRNSDSSTIDSGIESNPQAETPPTSPENTVPTTNLNVPESYVVQTGDTLARICYKFYNNSNLMRQIMSLNDISDPDKIYVGQKLLLPQP